MPVNHLTSEWLNRDRVISFQQTAIGAFGCNDASQYANCDGRQISKEESSVLTDHFYRRNEIIFKLTFLLMQVDLTSAHLHLQNVWKKKKTKNNSFFFLEKKNFFSWFTILSTHENRNFMIICGLFLRMILFSKIFFFQVKARENFCPFWTK